MQPSLDDVERLAVASLMCGKTLTPLERYGYLLEGPDAMPPPRLPQNYRQGILSVGVVIDGQTYVVRGDREIISAEQFGTVNYGLTNVRFSKDGMKRFGGAMR